MPQLTTISLNDRETTPVAHVFAASNIVAGTGYMVRSTGVPVGDETLSISSRKAGTKRKVRMVIALPQVQTVVGANGISTPVVVRRAIGEVNFTYDETSSTQERKNLVGLVANALLAAQTTINSVVVDLENVF